MNGRAPGRMGEVAQIAALERQCIAAAKELQKQRIRADSAETRLIELEGGIDFKQRAIDAEAQLFKCRADFSDARDMSAALRTRAERAEFRVLFRPVLACL